MRNKELENLIKELHEDFDSNTPPQTPKRKKNKLPAIGNRNGNLSEMCVAADLIKREYWVFHSIAGNAPCDLIVMKYGYCYRVEVKTAHIIKGRKTYSREKHNDYDILALYFMETGEIEYRGLSEKGGE